MSQLPHVATLAWPDAGRQSAFQAWLQQVAPTHGLDVNSVVSASADASFRRYFRVQAEGGLSFIVMDAPPQHEDCRPFVKIARLLTTGGVKAPEVLA